MLKVHICERCPYCDGKAYLPAGEATSWKGKTYTRFAPCQMYKAFASTASESSLM